MYETKIVNKLSNVYWKTNPTTDIVKIIWFETSVILPVKAICPCYKHAKAQYYILVNKANDVNASIECIHNSDWLNILKRNFKNITCTVPFHIV